MSDLIAAESETAALLHACLHMHMFCSEGSDRRASMVHVHTSTHPRPGAGSVKICSDDIVPWKGSGLPVVAQVLNKYKMTGSRAVALGHLRAGMTLSYASMQ